MKILKAWLLNYQTIDTTCCVNEYFVTWASGVLSVTMSEAAVICETGEVSAVSTVKDEASGTEVTVFCCGTGVEFTDS